MSESISLHAWMFSISWFFQHVKFTSGIVGIRYFIREWVGANNTGNCKSGVRLTYSNQKQSHPSGLGWRAPARLVLPHGTCD